MLAIEECEKALLILIDDSYDETLWYKKLNASHLIGQLIKEYFELIRERSVTYNDLIQQNNDLENALDKAYKYLHEQDIRINMFDPAHEIDKVDDWKEECMKYE